MFMSQHPKIKTCIICGKPRWINNSKYCRTCSQFSLRMVIKQFPPKTREAVWDYVKKNGYVCYYTKMQLDMTDPHSPWYCVFDHWKPHDSSKIVITSSLLNDMKSDLSENEFWYLIKALADYKRHGAKIRQIKIKYWGRDYRHDKLLDRLIMKNLSSTQKEQLCCVCGKAILHVYSRTKYCRVCARYMIRMKEEKFPADTMKEICDYIHDSGYICYYTEMPLEVNDSGSPWYCVFDHWMPHNPSKIVLTSAVLNDMKSDLLEEEFWYYIKAFADYKTKGKKVIKKKLVSWNRLYSDLSSPNVFIGDLQGGLNEQTI